MIAIVRRAGQAQTVANHPFAVARSIAAAMARQVTWIPLMVANAGATVDTQEMIVLYHHLATVTSIAAAMVTQWTLMQQMAVTAFVDIRLQDHLVLSLLTARQMSTAVGTA